MVFTTGRRWFAPKDLPRKYASKLHANEIVLLAYYIASVNIESVYHDLISHGDTEARRPSDPNSVSPCLRVSNDTFALTKMRFAKKDYPVDENHNGKLDRWELEDRGRIIYNDNVTIRGIPMAAYDYVVNGKSAIEWIMERYQVTTNKDSGIVNDPNAWLAESGNPRYVVDLILKVVTVSMETNKIVSRLPRLTFDVPAK